MSIKLIALDVYRAQQKVDRLAKALEEAELKEQDGLQRQLREAEEDLRQLRRMLDGAKKPLPFRTSFKQNQ